MIQFVSKFSIGLLLVAFGISTSTAQGTKIKWEDPDGREFSITAPKGEFSYGMIAGDDISYDYKGRVSWVGKVQISYDYQGRVSYVGRLSVNYDYQGRISGTSGRVY